MLLGACETSRDPAPTADPAPGGSLFIDITERSGLDFVHDAGVDSSYYMPEITGSGGAFLDYDGDDDLDIYLVNGARHGSGSVGDSPLKNRLYRQDRGGRFVDVTDASGLGDRRYGMGVAVGDIDNDGNVDVYVTNVGPDALYRNNGDGTFTDVTAEAGISAPDWGASAAFFDYDLDGFLDLYATSYLELDPGVACTDEAGRPDYCGPRAFRGVPDVLYRNNGDGTFTDVSVLTGIASIASKGLGVVSADFDGDGYPDVYVANDGEPNQLWINRGDGTFEDRATPLGAAVNALGHAEAGMGIALGDVDGDSDVDLFITHLRAESNTLYRNSGLLGFHDETSPLGLAGPSIPFTGFGTGFLDYDRDGDLDLVVANGRVVRGPLLTARDPPAYWDPYAEPNQLFENDGGRFRDVSERVPALSGPIENSRGLALGDVDDDGDLDLLITNGGGPVRLLRNDAASGHWLVVRALDPALRRDAIGAVLTVFAGPRRLHRPIAPACSFLSSCDPRAHFGLGASTTVDSIVVRWPGGFVETFSGVAADTILTLRRGEAGAR
ncbi:MAG: CRTAC1 family protein [Gemmatimonadota bacterium]